MVLRNRAVYKRWVYYPSTFVLHNVHKLNGKHNSAQKLFDMLIIKHFIIQTQLTMRLHQRSIKDYICLLHCIYLLADWNNTPQKFPR